MIGQLTGTIVDENLDGQLVVNVQGVGYEVTAPFGTAARAPRDEQGAVTLQIHTHLRQDALELFAFAGPVDRMAFRRLISISKVGPKLAMAILSVLSVDELAQVVQDKGIGRLTKVPGVGRKTAERIILELEGKLIGAPSGASKIAAATDTRQLDTGGATLVVEALVRMGFKGHEAERAVASLPNTDAPVAELIRGALGVLSS